MILSLAAIALYVGGLFAQQTIIAPQNRVASSFAIFIDDKSYEACKDAVMAYKKLLEDEGLATYLLVAEWQNPEHVKFFLEKYYKEQAMEGAVFIGNIPIAMVRKAQHMTSALHSYRDGAQGPAHDLGLQDGRRKQHARVFCPYRPFLRRF